jgi:hypothetical protein
MKTLNKAKKMKTLLCAAVGTASHRHRLEACTWCGMTGGMLNDDKAVLNGKRYLTVFISLANAAGTKMVRVMLPTLIHSCLCQLL